MVSHDYSMVAGPVRLYVLTLGGFIITSTSKFHKITYHYRGKFTVKLVEYKGNENG